MQYEVDKVLEEGKVKLQWHGEPTRVLLDKKDGQKTEVATGDVVEVSVTRAKWLLQYSDLWTLEGDEPIEQPFREARKAAAIEEAKRAAKLDKKATMSTKKAEADEDEEPEEEDEDRDVRIDVEELTPDMVKRLRKPELIEALRQLEIDSEGLNVSEMKELLVDALTEEDDE